METKQCKMCGHFIQHYGLNNDSLYRLYCGHCKQGRLKRKRPDAPACEYFVPGEAREEAFVNKEYLSKKLLERILEMDLLPKIEDCPKKENP